jgi:hypothetical protein
MAKKMGNIYFSTSNGWLANLRKRHQIVFHKVCGGAGNVCEETNIMGFLANIDRWIQLRTLQMVGKLNYFLCTA